MRKIAGVSVLCLLVLACPGPDDAIGPEQVQPPPTVASVVLTPAADTLLSLGETLQLTAMPMDVNGNTFSGKTVIWASSDGDCATVTATGLVTAVVNGSVTITAPRT